MATPEEIRATIEAYAARMSARDKEGWLALFADDATFEDPVGSPVLVDRGQLAAFFDQTMALATELQLVIDRPITVCGDEAVMVFHVESLVGDQRYRVDIVDVFRVDDAGLITSQRAFWEPASLQPISM